jgi:single-strand DNA-binding protein
MYQKVVLIGRLGKDFEVKQLPSGDSVASSSLATTKKFTSKGEKQELTEWHNIVVFGKLADVCAKHLKKGSQMFCEGEIRTRSWEDKFAIKRYMTEIVVSDVKFLDSKKDDSVKQIESDNNFTSDDIPF